MAEGLCRFWHHETLVAASAGIERHGLNPHAVTVMAEIGIDISAQQSKTTLALADTAFDFVITVCGHADEKCPVFPARTKVIHRAFDDPPRLARTAQTAEEALDHYRRVRDEISDFVRKLPQTMDFLA